MKKKILYGAGWTLCFLLCFVFYKISVYRKIPEENISVVQIKESVEVDDNLAFQIVEDMRVGWNLGNTLDSTDFRKKGINSELLNVTPEVYYEMYWGNPVTTEKMIEMVAKAGFGAVRIPVTYYDHFDENYQIRQEWLDRVEEVVGYVLDNDLYCIINLHHEEAWLKADKDTLEAEKEHLEIIWAQIADRFKSYNEQLLFEGFNEIRDKENNWSNADISSYEAVNQLNQTFVNTIRSSSGYNKERFLIVNTYAGSTDQDILDNFKLPEDIIEEHLIVQVHSYQPLEFTWTEDEVFWTAVRNEFDEKSDVDVINQILVKLNARFVAQGIPVIIGEFGAWSKDNVAERVKYAEYMVSASKEYQITCFWWDIGGMFPSRNDVTGPTLLNRLDLSWYFPEIVDALVKSAD